MAQVIERYPVSRTSVYKYINSDPTFPKRKFIDGNSRLMVFDEAEIDQWFANRMDDRPTDQSLKKVEANLRKEPAQSANNL